MNRLNWFFLLIVTILLIPAEKATAKKKTEKCDREIWCEVMYRMAAPVLSNMSEGALKQNMLVELSPTWDGRNKDVTYMECFGRWRDWLPGCHCRMITPQREPTVNSSANGH